MGAVLGMMAFFIFIGILNATTNGQATAVDTTNPQALIIYYVVAFIVGYRESTFRELLAICLVLRKPIGWFLDSDREARLPGGTRLTREKVATVLIAGTGTGKTHLFIMLARLGELVQEVEALRGSLLAAMEEE
jgi:hypothetical protein